MASSKEEQRIDNWQTNANMIRYRLYAAEYLLDAQDIDSEINISQAITDYQWAQDTFDYVTAHGAGLGPFADSCRDHINRLSARLWERKNPDGQSH